METANALRPVLLKLNRQLRRELGPVGITGGQAALLHAIQKQPGIGVRGLADHEGVSAPAMCGYVDRLEAAGLVTRVRSQRTAAASGSSSPTRAAPCCARRARAAPPGWRRA